MCINSSCILVVNDLYFTLQSLNGVFVNGTKLSPLVAHILQEDDEVQIGVPELVGKPANFVWTFYKQYKVKVITRHKVNATNNNVVVVSKCDEPKGNENSRLPNVKDTGMYCSSPYISQIAGPTLVG